MRSGRLLLNMVAALALLVGLLPARAIASWLQVDCAMPCCQGVSSAPEPAKALAKPSESCCPSMAQVAPAGTAVFKGKQTDACSCTLTSDIPAPKASTSVVVSVGVAQVFLLASATPAFRVPEAELVSRQPGILGSDSGPPPSPPERPEQGRAPPVGLA